ncbi:uracil-xanthine permease family protein [Desulfallas thermosapovorans]|uniref:Xanthine/uracil permease n=1 Tax=Desulfallas thermosapovorans DSM 6562 TaxID=1121431 RepID=A0A5S4ZNK3_9FIRM|nr:solute carrier family 23 protein [Desulfallas thermosapovorans]TYO93949.1 xanthine/uracil permease [Desulfallas thermosapovorans DSM 6562]
MSKLKLKYGLDEVPPWAELILFSLQWLAISVPTIIIIGPVVAVLHFDHPGDQVIYVQKLFFITGLVMFCQLLWGHRLPLVTGPAAVLLIGVLAGQGSSMHAIYSSILIGGIILTLLSITGLFSKVTKFFTTRVVATILLLIAFTLTPTIMNLIVSPSGEQSSALFNILFAFGLILLMFAANKLLTGIWKSTLIIWAMLLGTLAYLVMSPTPALDHPGNYKPLATFFEGMAFKFSLEPGLLFSFLVCFLALSINDLGSIQSVGEMLKPGNMSKRITRGITFTGLANVLSGALGVIGPVNFSLSPGVIASTGCASRFTLIPAALGLLLLSFMPLVIGFMESIPTVIIGTALMYVMCSQISAGLLMAFGAGHFDFESGLIIGLPVLLGVVVAFFPAEVLKTMPGSLRPVIGNGFAMGVLAVMFLEHVVYRGKGIIAEG